MFGENPQRTSSHSGHGPTTSPKWTFDGGEWISDPLEIDQTVFLGVKASDKAYSVCALNMRTGDKKWCSETIGFTNGGNPQPDFKSGILYVGGNYKTKPNGDVYNSCALDAQTGDVKWCNSHSNPTYFTLISNGTIFTSSRFGSKIRAIDLTTGKLQWKSERRTQWNSFTLKKGLLITTVRMAFSNSGGPGIVAMDPQTGQVKWSVETSGRIYQPPTFTKNSVYVAGGSIYAVDLTNGNVRWKYEPIDPGMASAPAVANGVVYTSGRDPEAGNDKKVVALDAKTGDLVWQHRPASGDEILRQHQSFEMRWLWSPYATKKLWPSMPKPVKKYGPIQ